MIDALSLADDNLLAGDSLKALAMCADNRHDSLAKASASRRRRGLRYSLRTLLILLTIAGVWLAVLANRARDQRAAVARIEQLGGSVKYDWEFDERGWPQPDATPPGPPWLHRLIGPEYFQSVVRVGLDSTAVTDADMRLIAKLLHVETLSLIETQVSDAGLRELASWTELRELNLYGTDVTDEGVHYLANCKQLTSLILSETGISNRAAEDIALFTDLYELALDNTRVNSAGVQRVAGLPKLQHLSLAYTAVDDAAVETLAFYVSGDLKILHCTGTRISARGRRAIREACSSTSEIWDSDVFDEEGKDFTTVVHAPQWKRITDRLHALDGEQRVKLVDLTESTLSDDQVKLLYGLKHVELIDLRGAKVSDAAVQQLRDALPQCEIDR